MIERGTIVSFRHWGKPRPGVVLRKAADGTLMIIAGSTQAPHGRELAIRVDPRSRYGTTLDLQAVTWFKQQGLAIGVSPEGVQMRGRGRCPPGLLLELDKLIE